MDLERRPLVSLALPVFNGSRFLVPCLDCLRAQTYPRIELIVSDNGSTDDTPRICERYAALDGRIRFYRADRNRGAAWNHNRVHELARGTYFKWCGVDDLIQPRFVEVCTEALDRTPDAVLAYPRSIVIDDRGEPIERATDRLDLDAPDAAVRFRSLLQAWPIRHNPFYGVIRAASLSDVRPLGTFLANDRCLLAELALRGRFVLIDEYLMFRRFHAEHVARTREVEQQFLDPDDGRGRWTRQWRMLKEHAISAARAPMSPIERWRLLRVVAAWALEERAELSGELRGLVGHHARRFGLRRGSNHSTLRTDTHGSHR